MQLVAVVKEPAAISMSFRCELIDTDQMPFQGSSTRG